MGGREQRGEGGTQRSRLPLPVGSGSLERKTKKLLCTLQKAEEGKAFSQHQAPRTAFLLRTCSLACTH